MKLVAIDAGHGGSDPGAIASELVEKNLNLIVSLKIKEYLLANYTDVLVKLTRDKDKDLSPGRRVEIVNDFTPDLCVSIHHNYYNGAGDARGAEIIHAHYDEFDDKLALAILNRLAGAGMPTRRAFTKLNDRGADWYYMIRQIWDADTDAIIVEGGFLDNPSDAALLKSERYLQSEAEAIAISIAEYLRLSPRVSIEDQRFYISLARLHEVQIINTPFYWIDNAKVGRTVKGEYARALITKMADYIIKKG